MKINKSDDFETNNYKLKQTFLTSAISDIFGNIKFLDTKILIVMATMGVIIEGLISCKVNLMRHIKMYRSTDGLRSFYYAVFRCF